MTEEILSNITICSWLHKVQIPQIFLIFLGKIWFLPLNDCDYHDLAIVVHVVSGNDELDVDLIELVHVLHLVAQSHEEPAAKLVHVIRFVVSKHDGLAVDLGGHALFCVKCHW